MKLFSVLFFIGNAILHVALLALDAIQIIEIEKLYVLYLGSRLMLMPLLAAWVIPKIKKYRPELTPFILSALFFSWMGDAMLSFSGELFFISGLSCFLLAHLSYMLYYYKETGFNQRQILKAKKWLVLPFVGLIVLFLYFTAPNLKSLLVPVIIYSFILCGMALLALQRLGNVIPSAFYFTFFGALLFVASDFLIGVNAFYRPFNESKLVIMITYIIGQYLIGKGLILQASYNIKYS